MSDLKPFAFVLMPFDQKFGDIYKYGIKSTAEDAGAIAERVDEQHFSESILERVYRQIDQADFIIAEMTGKNPNVFYEVGYAHAKDKICALITQNADDIPFDLKHHPHVIYDGSIVDLQSKLKPKIDWMIQETRKTKSKMLDFSVQAKNDILSKHAYVHVGTFDLDITLTNKSGKRSPEIEVIYVTTSDTWTLHQQGSECPYVSTEKLNQNCRQHQITPQIKRLQPDAFLKTRVQFEGSLWSSFNGIEEADSYPVKGVVWIEVVTSEGTISYDVPVDLLFDEIPF